VTATYNGDTNHLGSTSDAVAFTIGKATATVVVTPYSVTYDGKAHTATVTSISGVNSETGATVGSVALSTTHTDAGTYADSWSFTGTNYNDIASTPITDTILPATLTATGRAVSAVAGFPFNGVVASFVNADPLGSPNSYSATITWGDGGSSSGTITVDDSGAFDLSGTHTYTAAKSYAISVTITHNLSDTTSATAASTAAVIENTGLLLLDSTAKGALTASGNASLVVSNSGSVNVDSGNVAGVLASGNASLKATRFDLHGAPGDQTSGNAKLTGTVASSASVLAVPADLAALPIPTPSGTLFTGNYGGQTSVTLQPGTYSSLQVSGNASVKLAPGVYYLKTGLSVSGNAQVTGQDVILYLPSGSSLNISGNAKLTLTAPPSGTYQGVALFASGAVPVSITGNATFLFSGTIYAAGSTLTVSGNAVLQGFNAEVVAADLNESGNASVQIQANAFNRVLPLGDITVVATGKSCNPSGTFSLASTGSSANDPTVTDLALLDLMAKWSSNCALAFEDDLLDSLVLQLAVSQEAAGRHRSALDVYFSGRW
jgi:hypothetical protein